MVVIAYILIYIKLLLTLEFFFSETNYIAYFSTGKIIQKAKFRHQLTGEDFLHPLIHGCSTVTSN